MFKFIKDNINKLIQALKFNQINFNRFKPSPKIQINVISAQQYFSENIKNDW